MNKFLSSRFLYLLLCLIFITVSIFIGCGDNGTSPLLPDTLPTPVTPYSSTVPMPDIPLSLGAEAESKSLFSIGISIIMDGLKEGLTITIAKNTTGRILDIIGNQIGFGAGEENRELAELLKEMDEKMDMMIEQLNSIENQLAALSAQLDIVTVEIENYINSTALVTWTSKIDYAFSEAPDSFMYFSEAGSKLDPNADPNSPYMLALKASMDGFCDTYLSKVDESVNQIHDLVCPSDTLVQKGILKDYTNHVILTNSSPKVFNPNNAMESYLLLETFFAQILNYQTKGCNMIIEINHYKDPNDLLGHTDDYLNNKYKQVITDEVNEYLRTVNYLVVNLIDHRSINSFTTHSPNMFTTGLIHDDTYLMVLARARFFCAQVMSSYGDTSGLYGTIITPYYYDTDSNNPATSLVLQFSGPATVTKTINAQNIIGQYPYTRWYKDGDSRIHCCPDYNWSCYDFSNDPNLFYVSLDPDLPGGNYQVSLVDNGNQNSPWYHSLTDLGHVSIKYYDPQNPDPGTATLSPTEQNTFKFGYFASRWYWGYNKISLSPLSDWVVPDKHDVYYNNLANHSYTENEKNPTFHGNLDDEEFGPANGIFPVYNYLIYGRAEKTSADKCCAAYKIKFPFIVDGASDDTDQASAELYYFIASEVDYSSESRSNKDLGNCQYYYYHLRDIDKDKEYHIIDDYKKLQHEKSSYFYGGPVYYNDISDIALYKDHKQELRIDAGGTCNNGSLNNDYHFLINIESSWAMQIVYKKTNSNIFY